MNLKTSWKKIVKWGIWAVVGILFVVFLVRVATFEAGYYDEKEGSERAAVNSGNSDDLIETKPTEEEVKEYTVAPDHPRYLTIPALGIKNARILQVGVNTEGEMDTPRNIFDVGWYDGSGLPGKGGTMIIDGHNGGPHVKGVFKDLPDLATNEIIQVERGDGAVFKYKVVENKEVALSEADAYMNTASVSPERGKESVTLISCSGEWSDEKKTYLSRQFVRAVLVEESTASGEKTQMDDNLVASTDNEEASFFASKKIMTFVSEEIVNKISGVVNKEYDEMGGAYKLEFESEEAAEAALSFLQNEVGDDKVAVDQKIMHIMDEENTPKSWGTVQTNISALKEYANSVRDDSGRMRIAIIDTGCNLGHEMFQDRNIIIGGNYASGYDDKNDVMDDQGHGSHVAGIIAEGTSDKVDIAIYKAMDNQGSGYISDILDAIAAAVNDGANIINMSLGGNFDLSTEAGMFWKKYYDDYLRIARERGVMVLAASGNAGSSTCWESIPIDGEGVVYSCDAKGNITKTSYKTVSYPAASEYSLAISSYAHKTFYHSSAPQWPMGTTNYTFYSPNYSFYGSSQSSIAFAGAGDGIISASHADLNADGKQNDYVSKTGTSMATPGVAAAAAMLWSYYPDYEVNEIIELMGRKATDIGPAGDDIYFGKGYFDFNDLDSLLVDSPIYKKKIRYSTHVQGIGWQDAVTDGGVAGTSGLSKRIEALKINIASDLKCGDKICDHNNSGVSYRAHVQGIGWQRFMLNGELAGTIGEAKRIEALQMRLEGEVSEYYDIYYRTHIQGYGWLDWAKNEETAGSVGLGKRVEAIQVMLVEKGDAAPGATMRPMVGLISYKTHVQSYGWENKLSVDGDMSGTSGKSKRLEAIEIRLPDTGLANTGDIMYRVHAQSYGWMDWMISGGVAGTVGQGKRLEAIEINLLNDMAAKYDVCYKVHVQSYGWQDWVKNGELAGTTGQSKRLEAIQIKMVPDGASCE